jgi:30S ribosomal protein S31
VVFVIVGDFVIIAIATKAAMGKGDKKSKKGKISIGSYGNSRRRKSVRSIQKNQATPVVKEATEEQVEAKPKKTSRKKADA